METLDYLCQQASKLKLGYSVFVDSGDIPIGKYTRQFEYKVFKIVVHAGEYAEVFRKV